MLRIYAPEDRVPVAGVRTCLLEVRRKRNLTQGQLAQRLGVSRKIVERIEQNAVQTVDATLAHKLEELAQ